MIWTCKDTKKIPSCIFFLAFPFHLFLYVSIYLYLCTFFSHPKTMGRILAIDYGIKRTGIAVTDPERIIATGLCTVETPKLEPFLLDYCRKEPVDVFLVGEARRMSGEWSESMQYIEPFVTRLRILFPEKGIERIDERFTSKLAFQAMVAGGLGRKRRRDKGLVDQVSATIMLQDYMKVKGER